ncbi:hypothetical protein H8356DRAFT_1362925 [Neocallimastix lanati (nom. inval.)]|nr:hypothetical protein H8356DRAFT_1362925 [Neocallimastix sp. JGI-2020a]
MVDKENIDYLKWFIDKYDVYANLDKLFIKKLFDIKKKKTYFISLVHDSYEIQIPAPIDGVFIVEGIEKVFISLKSYFILPFSSIKMTVLNIKNVISILNFQAGMTKQCMSNDKAILHDLVRNNLIKKIIPF